MLTCVANSDVAIATKAIASVCCELVLIGSVDCESSRELIHLQLIN